MLRKIKSLFFKNDRKTNLNFISIDPEELKFKPASVGVEPSAKFILGNTPKTEGACHTSAKSDWKKRAIHGFYKRKTDSDGHTYYVRESTSRGMVNEPWYPSNEGPTPPPTPTPTPPRTPTPEPSYR